jgi:hypothetical protein
MPSNPHKRNLLASMSIRAQLLCLLIGIATVIIFDRTREISAETTEQIELAEEELLRTAQRGSARETEMLNSAKAVLALAARDPHIRNDSPTSCQPTFRTASAALPWLVDLSLISTAGGLVCTSSTLTTSRGVADRPYFQQAMRTREFALSDFLTSRLSHKPGRRSTPCQECPALEVDSVLHHIIVTSIGSPECPRDERSLRWPSLR